MNLRGEESIGSRTRRGRAVRQRGDSLVEFAIILPVLLLILMAILDFGRAAYVYNVVANAAREGARYAMVAPTDIAGIQSAVWSKTPGLDPAHLAVDISYPDASTVAVEVSYDFYLVTPMLATALGGTDHLHLRSTSRAYISF
ncbi:MAG: pilus assembly protein [Chloroflexi bacterium]|nr:pilus assembly protein [Chloroflexota bacterium]